MRQDILERQLQLMVLLTQNRNLTQNEISEKLGFTRRTYYRYLEAFRRMGFVVVKEGSYHRLDRSSPFFSRITELVHFTEAEAVTLRGVLDSLNDHSPEINYLREKLARLYNGSILRQHASNKLFAENLRNLYEAVKLQRTVILHDYRSARSDTVTDRVVEPFQFVYGNEDVRCYETASDLCKTFKVERIGRVSVLDLKWGNKDKHVTYFTDLFHFSSENFCEVTLSLDRLAMELLLEEHPLSEPELTPEGDRWIWKAQVCSWKGIGRFVLGLAGDIQVLSPQEFIDYLHAQPHF